MPTSWWGVTGRRVLRQAKALADCPRNTAKKAAPEAVARTTSDGSASPKRQPATARAVTNASISITASVGPSTPNARRATSGVDEVATVRGLVEDIGSGRLAAERHAWIVSVPMSRPTICSTPRARGKDAAAEGPDDERGELGDVVGEVIGEEASDVAEGGPALLDGGHDRGEVVVEEDEVGGLPGDVGARRRPWRPRCRPSRSAGPSLTPSPVIATTWPRSCRARGDAQLVLGG